MALKALGMDYFVTVTRFYSVDRWERLLLSIESACAITLKCIQQLECEAIKVEKKLDKLA